MATTRVGSRAPCVRPSNRMRSLFKVHRNVRFACAADALESEANYGVWGGLTERERRAILRHYPHAEDWLEWLRSSDEPLARELRSPRVPKILSYVRPLMAGKMTS